MDCAYRTAREHWVRRRDLVVGSCNRCGVVGDDGNASYIAGSITPKQS